MEKIVVSCLESRIDENQGVYSRFLLGPFLSGHAVTVATALRRALLSEVKNIAITALHIQGVTHEFSTVVGIRESVLELSLNFQQIILSTQTKPRSVQIGYLHIQGPAIVHANDLKLPDGIECVNPTQYIATLSTEGLLVVKFLIGEKQSFLKSNTSTLNTKKIKEAKAYSAQLSKSLLSHPDYDPPRLFSLLRSQTLPNGAIARRAIEEANLLPELRSGWLCSAEGGARSGLRAGRRRAQTLLRKVKSRPPARFAGLAPFGGNRNEVPVVEKGKGASAPHSSVASVDNPGEPNLVSTAAPAAGSPPVNFGPLRGLEQNLLKPSSTLVEFVTGSVKQTQKIERPEPATGSVGPKVLKADLEVPRLTDQRRDMTIGDADSKLDQSANLTSDEFNSEVCLRTIIPLDPIFTPVYQVNFGIERDDLSNQIRERVIMEVWTNGSIHPRQAINEAALSTISIFSKLRNTFQLDSHSLALSATGRRRGSTAPSANFARGSRLHKTKSPIKGGQLNDDASESFGLGPSKPLRGPKFTEVALRSKVWQRSCPEHVGLQSKPKTELLPTLLRKVSKSCRNDVPATVRSALGSSVLAPSVLAPSGQPKANLDQKSWLPAAREVHWRPIAQKRFARQLLLTLRSKVGKSSAQEKSVNFRRFALAKPNVTKYDLTNPARPKLTSFSSLGFVRSRHPVPLFLHNFGKSHIRGQTFLLEQSFGLKARFFKGHRTVLSKAKHTSEGHTFKRTFLPSFKVVGGPCGAVLLRSKSCRNIVPATTNAILSSLTRRETEQTRDGGRLSSAQIWPPSLARRARLSRPSEAGQFAQEPKPILFLIKYRTFSFTRNALRVFGCKQEDSSFLLPLTKQLIRVKMARVLTSCLPLMSKRSEPSIRFQFAETQAITTVEGSDRFDVKPVLLSLARSALRLQNNPFGSNFATQSFCSPVGRVRPTGLRAPARPQSPEPAATGTTFRLPPTGVQRAVRSATSRPYAPTELRSASPFLVQPSAEHGRTFAHFATQSGQKLPELRSGSRSETAGFLSLPFELPPGCALDRAGLTKAALLFRLRRPPASRAGGRCSSASVWQGSKLCFSKANSRPELRRQLLLRKSSPVGSQKESLEVRAPQKRIASSIALRTITPLGKVWLRSNPKKQFGFFQFACNSLQVGRRCAFVQASRSLLCRAKSRRCLERLGVCVNITQPVSNRSGAGASAPSLVRAAKRSWIARGALAPLDFTTFLGPKGQPSYARPLLMTKVPPLCLPSGLVTLISSCQEYRRPALARLAMSLSEIVRRRWVWPELRSGNFCVAKVRPRGGLENEPATGGVRRCFLGPFGAELLLRKSCRNVVPEGADLFGFPPFATQSKQVAERGALAPPNEGLGVCSKSLRPVGPQSSPSVNPFQLTTQKRLSTLYSSNLDKMSFLSSDLANLSLSLKTYTFLKKKGKKNIASLLGYSPNTLFALLNGDEKMFYEIERCFLFLGLPFSDLEV